MASKTIVFIHGMFMTPLCWEGWIERFRSKGYTCLAPAWPGRDKPVEALRQAHPDPQLGLLTLSAVIEHIAGVIQQLPEKPVLVGHSMGGLAVQLLLPRGLGSAGVAIDPAPPLGVLTTEWSFWKANFPMVNPLIASGTPRLMSFEDFQYAFVNAMPPDEQRRAYDRYTVPESRRVPRQSLTGVARIDFSKPHPPLLITAGSEDHIVPAALNRSNYARYRASASVTDFKEFPGRCHFIIGQSGWEEVADYVLGWMEDRGAGK